MGTQYEVVPVTGSSTVQVQPNLNYPEVVGISGTRVTPFLSLSIGNQYSNVGVAGQNYRCTQVTFNNGTFFNARVLPDGGNDCTITFTSIANASGQYYEGTYSANVSQIGGGDGGVYPMTNGAFRAKRP